MNRAIISRNFLDRSSSARWLVRDETSGGPIACSMVLTGPVEFVGATGIGLGMDYAGFGCTVVAVADTPVLVPPVAAIFFEGLKPLAFDGFKFLVDGEKVSKVDSLVLLPNGDMFCLPVGSKKEATRKEPAKLVESI